MIVFLLEEKSMKEFLNGVLPSILEHTEYKLIAHEGKGDLMKSIPIKLKAWNMPNTTFVIVHDQDNRDCIELKREIADLCRPFHRDVIIRIVCHELESWYFGDLSAVERAYNVNLRKLRNSKKYKNPDEIAEPKKILKQFIPQLTQIEGAKRISSYIDVDSNSSHSMNVLIDSIRKLR